MPTLKKVIIVLIVIFLKLTVAFDKTTSVYFEAYSTASKGQDDDDDDSSSSEGSDIDDDDEDSMIMESLMEKESFIGIVHSGYVMAQYDLMKIRRIYALHTLESGIEGGLK